MTHSQDQIRRERALNRQVTAKQSQWLQLPQNRRSHVHTILSIK
jgi:hypothetical protein